ncbi:two component transcriptional regulator, LytTR family [Dyella sp. OK004]|uniref:LytR/AlgR family response regulator transcription factor n=1 Tax=Dyella sp. OK004 TaxID=1855292 RepID=UPI0008EE8740|nr:LytTR family DNA-binding domain-containing protein [Dyella sp. OK004]SFS18785.1 two component transcriptional regulator, LytTR family [Dyella sp. OK004]
MSIRTLVVDDEPIARHSVVRLLREDADIDILGEYGDGASALEAIRRCAPDLVFLDIQMPEMTGIDVIANLGEGRLPATVFITAYEQYAVRAFEANAVDYLVKPFSRDRFITTLRRAKHRLLAGEGEAHAVPAQMLQALAELRREQSYARRIPVPVDGSVSLLDVADIDWIEANRNSVLLHMGKQVYELRETMTALEGRLNPRHFARVHRSAIVNIDRIKAIHPWFKGYHMVVLTTGEQLRMSRYQHETFMGLARFQARGS